MQSSQKGRLVAAGPQKRQWVNWAEDVLAILGTLGGTVSVVSYAANLRFRTASLAAMTKKHEAAIEHLEQAFRTENEKLRLQCEGQNEKLRAEFRQDLGAIRDKVEHLTGLITASTAAQAVVNKFMSEMLQRDSLRIEVLEKGA